MSDPRNFIDEFQRRYESSQEFEDRFMNAQDDVNARIWRATHRELAQFHERCAAAVDLHGHGSMAHSATVDLAHAQYKYDTRHVYDLGDQTLRELLEFDEVSDETSEAWSALIKPRLVVVSPEPSNQEAA